MSTDQRVNAKGDIFVGVGDNELAVVPIGQPSQVLTADPTRLPGVSWQDAAGGAAVGFTTTGPFIGTFGLCGNGVGTWLVSPTAWRAPAISAAAGDLLDWRFGAIMGAITATGDAELDLAAINNTDPANPVILRALSSGTNTPLPRGFGGLYVWQASGRELRVSEEWQVAAGDIVGGTVTLALLYKNMGSGLSVGHDTVYPNRVSVINHNTIAA